MLKDLLTVVVICYDPYIDAIELSPYFFKKYWPNCTANVLYVTGNIDKVADYPTVTTGGDLSYPARLNKALESIKTKYALLLLDDYLINKKIDEKLILENIQYMEQKSIEYMELFTMFFKPKGKRVDDKYLLVSDKTKYRINLQPSIFTKDLLVKLSQMEFNSAWEAELAFMDERFKQYQAYFSLNKSFSIINYIDKGLVTRKAYRVLKKEGLWNNQRKLMSVVKTIKKGLVTLLSPIIPNWIKQKIKGDDKIYKG